MNSLKEIVHTYEYNIVSFQFVCFQLDAWIYDTFKTYLMGLALYLVVEAPFGHLTRQMFGRG